MPKLRHIALAAEDPFAAAEFYKQAFDFTEVSRSDKSDDPKKSYGVFLSDGTLSLAVLHFGWDQARGSTSAASTISACWSRTSTR
jgi:catechol 2,3-dioxygenase-like lactoylglutathione lyase family enzyme